MMMIITLIFFLFYHSHHDLPPTSPQHASRVRQIDLTLSIKKALNNNNNNRKLLFTDPVLKLIWSEQNRVGVSMI
jgi:hypothetical protein